MKLDRLVLQGDPLEVAFHLGRLRRSKIERRIDYWNRHLRRLYRGRQDQRRNKERAFLKFARSHGGTFLEEIRAMAEGAGVPFADLFRLNLTELSYYLDKCTDLIWPVRQGRRRGILIAHNEDWDPMRNDVFHLQVRLPGVSYQVLAYDGYLPGLSSGVNSYGLIHSVNFLLPQDRRLGLPRIFLARYLVTAKGIGDFLGYLKTVPRAFGQAVHLAKGERYLGLELTARRQALLRPSLPAVHANHYLSRALKKSQPAPGPSSRFRQSRAEQLLAAYCQGKKRGTFPLAAVRSLSRNILGDDSTHPFALCRRPNDQGESSSTLAMVMADTLSLSFRVRREI